MRTAFGKSTNVIERFFKIIDLFDRRRGITKLNGDILKYLPHIPLRQKILFRLRALPRFQFHPTLR